MKLVILHLSDIHLSTERYPTNPVLNRHEAICAAVRAMFEAGVDACVTLVSGDLAFQGLPAEYDLATQLLDNVDAGLRQIFGDSFHSRITLPGNHDCDFAIDDSARKTLIGDPDLAGFGDGSTADACTKVQDAYFHFAERYAGVSSIKHKGIDRIVHEHALSIKNTAILFRVLNTAWCSQRNEKAHSLLMPVDVLRGYLKPSGADVVITAFHHPYSWLEPTNGRQLKKLIEETSDVIFTGHEHVSDSYSKNGHTGSTSEYIEAGPLQENGIPSNSEFNVVVIDTAAQTFRVHHFAWEGGLYTEVNATDDRPFVKNSSRLSNEFLLNDDFRAELNAAEVSLQSQLREEPSLQDIFVYPDLRESPKYTSVGGVKIAPKAGNRRSGNGEARPQPSDRGTFSCHTIHGRQIADYVARNKRVVVSGRDRSGKSALCRTLFKDFSRRGHVPLLLDGSKLNHTSVEKLQPLLNRILQQQYKVAKPDRFWQLDKDQRVLFIDNFDALPQIRSLRTALLAEVDSRFGTVVLFGGSLFRFQELLDPEAEANHLFDYIQCDISPFGLSLRSQLIRRWFVLNRGDGDSDEYVDTQIAKIESIISLVLDRDLMPSHPENILLLLQPLQINQPVDTGAASYGKLCQAYLTSRVSSVMDVETGFSYLGELAFHFFDKKLDSFSEAEAIAWHATYIAEFKDPIDFHVIMSACERIGVLNRRRGTIQFKVRAAFYFFVAYRLSRSPAIAASGIVDDLTTRLHREDASNIVLFLCHLLPSSAVAAKVVEAANAMFTDLPEATLPDDVLFTGNLVAALKSPVLDSGDPEARRQRLLSARDAQTVDNDPTDDLYAYRREEETKEDSENRRLIAKLNGAYKTIKIIGQMIRGYSGGMRGDERKMLVTTAISLGLRLLSFVFEAFRLTHEPLGKAIADRIGRNNTKLSKDECTAAANAGMFAMVELCTRVIIRYTAISIGIERLHLTFKDIREERNTLATRIIDAAIKLEHFSVIPEDEMIEVFDEVKNNLLLASTMKTLMWEYLSYHHCERRKRERLCDAYEIKLLPSAFNDDQKHGSKS